MKRKLSIFLSVMLILSMFSTYSFAWSGGGDVPTLIVSSTYDHDANQVTAKVDIGDYTNLGSASIRLLYDNTKLSVASGEYNTEMFTTTEPIFNLNGSGFIAIAGAFAVSVSGSSRNVFTVTFDVVPTQDGNVTFEIADGDYTILSDDDDNEYDADAIAAIPGSILVDAATTIPDALTGTAIISGSAICNQFVEAVLTGDNNTGELHYQWKSDGVDVGTDMAHYLVRGSDVGKTLTCEISSSIESGFITAGPSAPAVKAGSPSAPNGIQPVRPSAPGAVDGKITGTSADMEYSTDPSFASPAGTPCTAPNTENLGAGTYYVRVAETATAEAGASKEIVIPEGVALRYSLDFENLSTLTAAPGDQFTFDVYVKSKDPSYTSVAAIDAFINYDSSKVEYVSCTTNSALSTGNEWIYEAHPTAGAISMSYTLDIFDEDKPIDQINGTRAYTFTFEVKSGVSGSAVFGFDAISDGVSDSEGEIDVTDLSSSITLDIPVTVESIAVSSTTHKTEYVVDDSIDLTGLTIDATMSDGTIQGPITVTPGMISGFDSSAYASGQTVTITYGGKTATYTVNISRKAGPAAPAGIGAVKPSVLGAADGQITGTDATMEYATDDAFTTPAACTASPTAGLSAGTYYVRYAQTTTAEASEWISVTVPEGDPAVLTGTAIISGTEKYEETLTVTVTGDNNTGTLSYQWKSNGTNVGTDSATYTIAASDIGNTITCEITSSVETGSITGGPTGTIGKKAGLTTSPSGLSFVTPSAFGLTDGAITGTDATMEYSTDPSFASPAGTPCTAPDTEGLGAGTYYVRVAETATTEAGAAAEIIIPEGEPVITGISVDSTTHKISYTVGDSLDVTDLTIEKAMSDGTTQGGIAVTPGMISGFDSSAVAAGQVLTITYEGQTATYTIDIEEKTVTVSGSCTSYGSSADVITIEMIKSGETAPSYTTSGAGIANYSITGVKAGTYTMNVSKNRHVTENYTVVVGDTDVTQDVSIYLLGDVNKNGNVTAVDAKWIIEYVAGIRTFSANEIKLADVNNSGNVTAVDSRWILQKITEIRDADYNLV